MEILRNDIIILGKHSEYANYLCKERGEKREDGVNLFNSVIDLYTLAPLIGLHFNRSSPIDNSNNFKTTIFAGQVFNHMKKLSYVYSIVMLNTDLDNPSSEERINNAFRYTNRESSKAVANKHIFHGYALGGIEVLYEYFTDDLNNDDELFRHVNDIINEFRKTS